MISDGGDSAIVLVVGGVSGVVVVREIVDEMEAGRNGSAASWRRARRADRGRAPLPNSVLGSCRISVHCLGGRKLLL